MGYDADAQLAHYAIQMYHWTPAQYMSLTPYEKAFVRASIAIQKEQEAKRAES